MTPIGANRKQIMMKALRFIRKEAIMGMSMSMSILTILMMLVPLTISTPALARDPIGSGTEEKVELFWSKSSPCTRALDFGNPCRIVTLKNLGIKTVAPGNWNFSVISSFCAKITNYAWSDLNSHIALCTTQQGADCTNISSTKSVNCACQQNPFAFSVWQQAKGRMCQNINNMMSPDMPYITATLDILQALELMQECTVPIWYEDPCPHLLQREAQVNVPENYIHIFDTSSKAKTTPKDLSSGGTREPIN